MQAIEYDCSQFLMQASQLGLKHPLNKASCSCTHTEVCRNIYSYSN